MPPTVSTNPSGDRLLAFGALLGRSCRIIESEVSGGSMGNTLPSGCRIRIRPLPAEEYRAGQVVAIVAAGKLFAHRIVYRSRQGVLTRGDTHAWCDLPIPASVILGVVSEYLLDGKWCAFDDTLPFDCEITTRHRMIDILLQGCLHVDLSLARKASRTLMWLAHQRRLFGKPAPPGKGTK